MKFARRSVWAFLTVLVALTWPARAAVRLPHVISDYAVFQRDTDIPVWGWAAPGEAVTVELGKNRATAKADAAGNWSAQLPAMTAGGPHTLTVSGTNRIVVKDVLIGEVWVCSGQSNMVFLLPRAKTGRAASKSAMFPKIRLLTVPRRMAGEPQKDVGVAWQVCSPESAARFSAVAFFFGRELHRELGVPVGLINTSWGGTRIEPWTSPAGFASVPALQKHVANATKTYRKRVGRHLDALDAWTASARGALAKGHPIPPMPRISARLLTRPSQPLMLYNAMVHPLTRFAIRGAIWYQGESNQADGPLYSLKMRALIQGWRKAWGQGDFPFYYVQIAPYSYGKSGPPALARFWEAQTAALSIPNTGMAVVTDVGNLKNIHPRNKSAVGKRLALWALAKTYGRKDLVYCGPFYKDIKVEGGAVRVSFDPVGGGLAVHGKGPLVGFQVAGADGKFVDARAVIDGATVVVSSPAVPQPVAVRYGWTRQGSLNLMNKEGLPACPFRSDKEPAAKP